MVLRLRGVQKALPGNAVRPDAENARPRPRASFEQNGPRIALLRHESQRGRNDQNRRGTTPNLRWLRLLVVSPYAVHRRQTCAAPSLEDASDHIPETKVCQSPKWTAAGATSQKGAASRFQKNVGETQRLCNQSAGSRADTAEATKVDGRGRCRARRCSSNWQRRGTQPVTQPCSSSINATAGGQGQRQSFVAAIRSSSSWRASRCCTTTGRRQFGHPGRKRAQHRGRLAFGLLAR